MKNTSLTPMRVRRFITDRYAYRAEPDYLSELITFGVIVLTVFWSMFALAGAMSSVTSLIALIVLNLVNSILMV